MNLKTHHYLIIVFSVVSILLVSVFSLIKVPINIRGELVTSFVKFRSKSDVDNLFAMGRKCKDSKILVSWFDTVSGRFSVKNESQETALEHNSGIKILREDSASRVVFNDSCVSSLDLKPKSNLSILIRYSTKGNNRDLRGVNFVIDNNDESLQVYQRENNEIIKLQNVTITDGTRSFEGDTILKSIEGMVDVHPYNNKLSFDVYQDNGVSYREYDTIRVDGLEFSYYRDGKRRSGIIGGNVFTFYDGKKIPLYRNSVIDFDLYDEFTLTSLESVKGGLKIAFEGKVRFLEVSDSGFSLIPNLLRYVSQNNMILLVINSFFAISAFFISIIKEAYDEDGN